MGQPAPPLSLGRTIPAGMSATWTALRGKPVVIEFWVTWCGMCVAEIPRLNELVTKFPDIQFLSITDEELPVVEPFLAKRPILGWVGLDAAGVEARPQTLLIDKDGVLRGVMHPAQVTDAVLADFVAGRPVSPRGLKARLHMFEDKSADPVFAVVLRPSSRAKAGGRFSVDPGALEGENVPLGTIISHAYSIGAKRLEGPDHLLGMRYDFCVLLQARRTQTSWQRSWILWSCLRTAECCLRSFPRRVPWPLPPTRRAIARVPRGGPSALRSAAAFPLRS